MLNGIGSDQGHAYSKSSSPVPDGALGGRGTHTEADWLDFIGGTTLMRDTVRSWCSGDEDDSIEALSRAVGARLLIVFYDVTADWEVLARMTSDPDRCAIAVAPVADAALFNRLLGHGFVGVTTEHDSSNHLIDVARAALNGDTLLPFGVLRTLLSDNVRPARSADLGPLTAAVLNELANGQSVKAIASKLSYSERTVRRRIRSICLMLGAETPIQAVHLAHIQGIL